MLLSGQDNENIFENVVSEND